MKRKKHEEIFKFMNLFLLNLTHFYNYQPRTEAKKFDFILSSRMENYYQFNRKCHSIYIIHNEIRKKN